MYKLKISAIIIVCIAIFGGLVYLFPRILLGYCKICRIAYRSHCYYFTYVPLKNRIHSLLIGRRNKTLIFNYDISFHLWIILVCDFKTV